MRRLLVPLLLLGLATPMASIPAGAAGGEVPRVQLVKDPRGDVRAAGSVPASVRRSVDVRSMQVRRDTTRLRLRFATRDVRTFTSWEQGASLVFARQRRTQRFTVVGAGLLVGDPLDGRRCEGGTVTRRTGQDVMIVRIPFACLRTDPGELLVLRAAATATRADGDGGRAVDALRSVRTDAR